MPRPPCTKGRYDLPVWHMEPKPTGAKKGPLWVSRGSKMFFPEVVATQVGTSNKCFVCLKALKANQAQNGSKCISPKLILDPVF